MADQRGGFPWKKFIFRVLHVIPVSLLSGQIAYTTLFLNEEKGESSSREKAFYAICGVLLILSGLVNSHILDTSKMAPRSTFHFWIQLVIGKLIVSVLLFTPFYNKFVVPLLHVSQKQAKQVQVGALLVIFCVSSFLRFYREWKSQPLKRD